ADGLDQRGNVPTGRYRFHVEGSGWTLDSAPFTVVEGGLSATATRSNGQIHVAVKWHAPKGWRLMDMALMSNQPIPVRNKRVLIELHNSGVLSGTTPNTDANGNVDVPDNSAATFVRVGDPYGNSFDATLP
ncbi:MAG TPA: hypothetical protein VMZ53_24410, partial [Kofleriaceae bacterium]|nr:hypothetical protein [Kofleriaceae bacterium]